MTEFYSNSHRALQDQFDSRRLADALHDNVLRSSLAPMDRAFIAASDFFFLSTVDHQGFPTVSYKGGHPGFVKIVDDRTLAFPAYDGNGMFLSLGNIAEASRIGLLFIDFEQPRRLRLHGTARNDVEDPLLADYPEALLITRVRLQSIFTNCPRYIHPHKRVAQSAFVPRPGHETPLPEWKRVDYLQDALPEKDRQRAREAGARISEVDYRRNFWKGLE